MARILVLDGHSAAALAFTRSAGRAGYWVAVGANEGLFAAAKLSRYCRSSFSYPVSTDDANAFVQSVQEFARINAIDLIVPVTDWTLQPLSEERERFQNICRIVLPPHEAVVAASDKFHTVELARSLGLAVPRTWLIKETADLAALAGSTYPVVVKDRFSVRWANGRAVFGVVAYAYDNDDLLEKVSKHLERAGEVLVQEFVSGTGIGYSFFVTTEDTYLPFAWERIREVDPRGSASSCRKSIALEESMKDLSDRLVRGLGFQGIAMVEYKRRPDGSAVLMEVNGRPWGSIGLAIASGIDYPRYLVAWCLQGSLPPKTLAYHPDITCRRLVGELTHVSNVRRGKPQNWPGAYPNFWSTLAKVAIPWYPGMHYDDLWLSDPRPGVEQLKNWFRVRRGSRL